MTVLAVQSAEAQYQELKERFSEVFSRIAQGAREREQERVLPFEQV